LLDISLPDIDGWDVIRHIKASPHLKHVRVLALSVCRFDDGQILALKPSPGATSASPTSA